MSEYDHTLNPVSPTGHEWPCPGFYRTSSVKDRTERCTCVTPTTEQVRLATGFKHSIQAERFDRWLAEVERAAAARARGEAIIETVQAHRDLHKTYGSTSACRGGVGGQALTSHCAEICYNAGAHEKEMEAWQRLEVEAIEYSRARAAEIREGKLT